MLGREMEAINKPPKLSVIIPMHNAAQFLERAIDSVSECAPEGLEVICVDDASSDRTVEIARQLASERDVAIRLVELPSNVGVARARNIGVEHADGEYVCFLDADDIYLPNRFQGVIEYMAAHPDVMALYSPFIYQFDSEVRDERSARIQGCRHKTEESGSQLDQVLSGAAPLCVNTVTIRRRAFNALGGFPDIRFSEDKALWIMLAALGWIVKLGDQPVAKYVIHNASSCSTGALSAEALVGPVLARMQAIKRLSRFQISREVRNRLVNDLEGKILHRFGRASRLNRAEKKKMLISMLQSALVAPNLIVRKRYLSAATRLALAIILGAVCQRKIQ